MMSEKLKTIKELADEIGVSKQAVWQKIKKESSIDLRQFTSKKGNTVYVDVDGQKVIKSAFFNKTSTKKRQQKVFVDDNVNNSVDGNPEGNEEILFLRNLVSELQSEKKDLHKLLDQQQRLALQDKKVLEEYKSEINELKALKMPQEDMKEGSSIRGEAQEEIERLKAQLKLSEEERNKAKEKDPVKTESKKWWQLWK
ncbi:RepB family protein [Lactococcus lactis subsp. lactis bv. diacetylactis str. LD61]|nr:RepB family protein [Lactococcus lactis subsp. lactis bv. diacetylactis str. LD61]